MTNQDKEKYIKKLEKENEALWDFIFNLRNHIDTNLQPFRDNIADFEDERNKGILAVLTFLADEYNKCFRHNKIEMLSVYKCDVVKFKVIKGEKDVKD